MPAPVINNKSIEFVRDWQKRSVKQQKNFLIVLSVVLVAVIILAIFGFQWYQVRTIERIYKQNMNFIQDNTLQEARRIEENMDYNLRVIQKFAKQYDVLEEQNPEMSHLDRINILWDSTLFDRVSYVSPDGTDISSAGTANVSDRDYFQDAMSGQSGYIFIEDSRVTHLSSLMFYAPIHHGDEITGVMLGFYERSRIDSMLKDKFMNYEPRIHLLKNDGLVIGSSTDEFVFQNIFDILATCEFSGDVDYDQVMESINDKSIKTVAFTFEDRSSTSSSSSRSSIGVIGQFSDQNLMVFTVLPREITGDMIEEATKAGQLLMLLLAVGFIVIIIVFIFFISRLRKRMSREMGNATESLEDATDHDKRLATIVGALSDTYSSVYYVDIASEEYERIEEGNSGITDHISDIGMWREKYDLFIEHFVSEGDKKKMLFFRDIKHCAEMLEKGELLISEYQRPDGLWCRAMMTIAERNEDGSIKGAVFAVQRINDEKRRELETKKALEEAYEAARLASAAKTNFLSNISHDIRTPLNAIVGMTAIAGSNLDNQAKIKDCLGKISISSKHLLGIINEVLDMSKIETGKVDLTEEEFHLPDLFDELLAINSPLIKEKKHTLIFSVRSLEHENVMGDSIRLGQVFTNLLTNAIKYTPEGGKLEISVSEKPINKPNIGLYEVIFRDNGIGMSEEFQKSIFDPFTRANDSRIAKTQGTGLGMAIARNIIRMMNGDIKVESKLNEGSTFTVTFSLKLQHQDDVNYDNFVDLPVLVVDDDINACEATCSMLNSISFNSEYVTSGPEAVEKCDARHAEDDDYYAVIVDWQMPGMNGIETAKEIRRRIGDEIPIIVISAYDWTDIELEARAAGVNAFLSKPLFKSRLVNLFSELANKDEVEEAPMSDPIRKQSFAGKRILVAEDNELNREIAVEIFTMMGLKVDTAENGRVCLEMFMDSEPGKYDLIFMDIQMPEMDGYQAASAIRVSSHPQAKLIPIIAMSANAFSTDVSNAINSGMNGHVAKPIDIDAVTKVLQKLLRK